MATSDACLGCGLRSPKSDVAPDRRYNASGACWQLNLDLTAYTLTLGDKEFLHQLAVDTYGAQHVGEHSRPIGVAFALIGLYLTCDCGYTGRQVQHVHMLMANRTKTWPQFSPPVGRYRMTVADVLTLAPGEWRNEALRDWGRVVWEAWVSEHEHVKDLFARVMAD